MVPSPKSYFTNLPPQLRVANINSFNAMIKVNTLGVGWWHVRAKRIAASPLPGGSISHGLAHAVEIQFVSCWKMIRARSRVSCDVKSRPASVKLSHSGRLVLYEMFGNRYGRSGQLKLAHQVSICHVRGLRRPKPTISRGLLWSSHIKLTVLIVQRTHLLLR